ncbi:beta-N-acetylhexosaminidase [Thermodesulfobacteriota bacterium]
MSTTLEISELERKIGQLFMSGMPGTRLDEGTASLIRDYHLGGIILFSRNIEDPIQLAELCRDLHGAAAASQDIPFLLAVDQEGGRVARLQEPFRIFPGNAAIGEHDQPVEQAMEFGFVTAREMKLVGLNMNMAPVMDVRRGETEQHLEDRTFGENPEQVSQLGRTVIRSIQANGVMAVAKHFPGLGRAGVDPHVSLPRIEMDETEMEEIHLPPFRTAIDEGVSSIMTSHAIYPLFDPERPATLSPIVLTELLRERLCFEGLIITDDLEMGAITEHWSVSEGAARALEAGGDILLICKNQENVVESFKHIRGRILRGEITMQRLQESYERISKAKQKYLGKKPVISLPEVKEYFRLEP